jgi:hypothetical protein
MTKYLKRRSHLPEVTSPDTFRTNTDSRSPVFPHYKLSISLYGVSRISTKAVLAARYRLSSSNASQEEDGQDYPDWTVQLPFLGRSNS